MASSGSLASITTRAITSSPFKQPGEPELAFFLDMDPRYTKALRSQAPAREACARLTRQGFESNLYGELTPNPWRLLAHRTPLLQCGEFSIEAVAQRLRTLLQLVYAEQAFITVLSRKLASGSSIFD
jgi:hypothetical protein